MSTTTGYLVGADGIVRPDREFKNAWHGAMALWDYLARTFLDPKAPRGTDKYMLPSAQFLFDPKAQKSLWGLAADTTVPRHLRVAEMTTFDRAVLRRADFAVAADALDLACKEIVAAGGSSHLDQQAAWLRENAADENVVGAAWQQTSVSEDLWVVYDEGGEEGRDYDTNRDSGHWFIEISAEAG